MVPYLSPRWVEAVDRTLADSPALRGRSTGRRVVIRVEVPDSPQLRVYELVVDGLVRARAADPPASASRPAGSQDPENGPVHGRGIVADEGPTVTLVCPYRVATAVNRGEMSALGAFMAGLLRFRGDALAVVDNGDLLRDIGDVLGVLRAETEY